MNSMQPSGQQRKPNERTIMQQGSIQDDLRARQEGTPNTNSVVQHSMRPRYPNWPTSRPGPLASQPGVGQQPINALRREQMVEVGYNQETGTPRTQDPERYWPDEDLQGRTGFDQLRTAQQQAKQGDDPPRPWSRQS